MLTILINRFMGYVEMQEFIEIAKRSGANESTIDHLQARLDVHVVDSIWQSGAEFVVIFIIIGILAKRLVQPIKDLGSALERVDRGDLTVPVDVCSHDEIGSLKQSFNSVQERLKEILSSIAENSKQLSQSSFQVASVSKEIAVINRDEQKRSEELSTATYQLNKISTTINEIAQEAADRSGKTKDCALESVDKSESNIRGMDSAVNEVLRASKEMMELNSSTDQIHSFVDNINGIADQTNLLALNAAIESARAGDAGRGFAVVADEVRKLANMTTNSTKEIAMITRDLKAKTKHAVQTMESVVERVHLSQEKTRETAETIEEMSKEASEVASINNEISRVTSDQIEQLKIMQKTMETLFTTLKESSGKAESTSIISKDLHAISGKLMEHLSRFSFEKQVAVDKDQSELRQFPRISNNLRIQVMDGDKTYEAICKDISMGGSLVRCASLIPEGQTIKMLIYLPHEELDEYENQTPLNLTGEVLSQKRLDGIYVYGIKFVNQEEEELQRLKSCMEFFNKVAIF
ncbi:MAG: methyl-accepting chemotaxis protein [Proteobacteria bacterium]|nr:methyl-accepting chemotaxis protein [Pseudomonadota bacterium]